jgi:hypothetical protein
MCPSNPPTPCSSNHYTIPLSGHRRSVAIGSLRIWFPLLLMAGGAIAPPASGGSITYNIVNYPTLQNGYSVSGTITTDGTTGSITATDITTWDISVTISGSPLFTQTPSDSYFIGLGSFQATTTTIAAPAEAGFEATNDNTIFWNGDADLYEGFYGPAGVAGGLWRSSWPKSNIVATSAAVPEPSAIALLAMGALGAGAIKAYWSRHRVTQFAAVIEARDRLPEVLRAGILAMVKAVS